MVCTSTVPAARQQLRLSTSGESPTVTHAQSDWLSGSRARESLQKVARLDKCRS